MLSAITPAQNRHSGSVGTRQAVAHFVDFVKFKRYRIARIVDTDPRARLKSFRRAVQMT